MITQNPIIGRSRKKLGNVYSRTLWGKNILQTCPVMPCSPPTIALRASRDAFKLVQKMCHQISPSTLTQIYYAAPEGKPRRSVLMSQLLAPAIRSKKEVSFDLNLLKVLGTNRIVTEAGLIVEIMETEFSLPKEMFSATAYADTSRVPLIILVSYELGVCISLRSYTTLDGDWISFQNLSPTLIGHEVLMICLWETNIGTESNPNFIVGGYRAQP